VERTKKMNSRQTNCVRRILQRTRAPSRFDIWLSNNQTYCSPIAKIGSKWHSTKLGSIDLFCIFTPLDRSTHRNSLYPSPVAPQLAATAAATASRYAPLMSGAPAVLLRRRSLIHVATRFQSGLADGQRTNQGFLCFLPSWRRQERIIVPEFFALLAVATFAVAKHIQ